MKDKYEQAEMEAEAIKGLRNIVLDGVCSFDHPDYADAYVESAQWADGRDLTEDEIEKLNEEYPEIAQENAWESLL